jgi:hypothetical protein
MYLINIFMEKESYNSRNRKPDYDPFNIRDSFDGKNPYANPLKSEDLFNNQKNFDPYIRDKFKYSEYYKKDRTPFFIPESGLLDSLKNILDSEAKKPKTYTPRKEFTRRSDTGFYNTFYPAGVAGIFADYDDMIWKFVTEHNGVDLTFDPNSGKVVTEDKTVSVEELNRFIHEVLPFGVSAPLFEPGGSIRRVEERRWYQTFQQIDFSRALTSNELVRTGLTQALPKGITPQEIRSGIFSSENRNILRKFVMKRLKFWHPDMWRNTPGLTEKQQKNITEMAARVNKVKEALCS